MLKTLAKSIRQYKKETTTAPIITLTEVILDVLLPFFMVSLIDDGIEAGNMDHIIKMGCLLLVLSIFSLILGAFGGFVSARAAAGFAANLRLDLFSNLQSFSFSNIDKFSSSSLITRLTTDVNNVMLAYQAIVRQGVRGLAMVILAFVMSFLVNSKVAIIFLAIAPIMGLGLFAITHFAHPIFIKAINTYDRLNNVVQENIRGIRVVKSFVREEHEIEKFERISTLIFKYFTNAQKKVALNMPLIQFCSYAGMILVSWVGAKLIVSDSMTTGQLMSMISYTMQILMNLMMLSMVYVLIVISRSSCERICEVLNEQSHLQNGENPVYDVKDGSVVFENVSFSYTSDKDKPCLIDANISIRSGETIGIIGGTGSSKTSFVQLIPRLYDATEGSVLVGGINVRDYDLETLRNQVAFVLQKNVLFSGTISENLRWGNENATDEELIHACKLAQADSFIEKFPDKYETYIEQGGTNVSGGQRQRLCIARALLKSPKILILDDSTSAVDTKTDSLIQGAFKREIPDITKIIIAQRISSVMDADRIIVMNNGRINAVGTHEELLSSSDIYKEVYHIQMEGGGDFDEKN